MPPRRASRARRPRSRRWATRPREAMRARSRTTATRRRQSSTSSRRSGSYERRLDGAHQGAEPPASPASGAGRMSILVFLEHHGDELQKGALGVLTKAATLGDADVAAIIVGEGAKALAGE